MKSPAPSFETALTRLLRMRSVILMVRSREAASRTMKATVSR
jgi:hypothetical protein